MYLVGPVKLIQTPTPVALAAVPYKVVVLLLLISCFIAAPIVCWGLVFGPCFIMQSFVSFSSFAIISPPRKSELSSLL